jgi:invasion protein IalB
LGAAGKQPALVVVLLCLLIASPWGAAMPEHGQTFKDWTARCETPPGSEVASCYIFQSIVLKETGKRLVHVAVGYLAANGQAAVIVTLPLGISLPPGVSISIDGGEPVQIVVERCDTSGCIGAVALDDALIGAMKAGREGRIGFHDGTRRRIAVPLSLLGFTAGFDALEP